MIRENVIRRLMSQAGLDGLLVHNSPTLVYLTGVRVKTFERPMFLLTNGSTHYLFAPMLEKGKLERFERSGGKLVLYEDGADVVRVVKAGVEDLGLGRARLGIDETMELRYYKALKEMLERVEFVGVNEHVRSLRYVKSGEEIASIRKAVMIIEEVLSRLEKELEPGLSEAYLRALASGWCLEAGAEEVYFFAVQAGENSAVPHHEASSRRLRKGDVVVVDVSVVYNNYFGDLTRVFVLGEASADIRRRYGAIKRAVEGAVRSVRIGARASEIDAIARGILGENGLDRYFVHRLGHGLGVEVHEEPYLAPRSTNILAEGNVFTVEPGVYFEGEYGLRLERDVAVVEGEAVYLDERFTVDLVEV